MRLPWRMQKLAKYMNNVANIWTSDGEVKQASYKTVVFPWIMTNFSRIKRKFMLLFHGKMVGLQPISLHSSKISSTYLRWLSTMSAGDLATSIPRKYVSFPRSLIWNFAFKCSLSLDMQLESFPVMMRASTYIRTATKEPLGWDNVNKE